MSREGAADCHEFRRVPTNWKGFEACILDEGLEYIVRSQSDPMAILLQLIA